MPYSQTEICRLALSLLGANPINSLDDDTVEAGLCRENYPLARDAVLEEGDWRFALDFVQLNKLDEKPLISPERLAFYQVPLNAIRVSSVMYPSGETLDFWERFQDKILAPNIDTLIAIIVNRETDTYKYTPNFCQAIAARMAAMMAPALTNSADLAARYWGLYDQALKVARTNDSLQGGDKFIGRPSDLIEGRKSRPWLNS